MEKKCFKFQVPDCGENIICFVAFIAPSIGSDERESECFVNVFLCLREREENGSLLFPERTCTFPVIIKIEQRKEY